MFDRWARAVRAAISRKGRSLRDHPRTPSLHALAWLLAVGVGCTGSPILGALGDASDASAASDVSDVPLDVAPDVSLDVARDTPPMDTPPPA